MAASRRCSECGKALGRDAFAQRITCSDRCRARRSKRMQRNRKKAAKAASEARTLPEHLSPMSQAVSRAVKDELHEVAKEELRPVVREALTDDVLQAAGRLVGLTGLMVSAIEEDLQSHDKQLRQKAYSLLARYTLGNQSIAPQADSSPPSMHVEFHVPRPSDAPADVPAEAVELNECDDCHESKPATEFVAGSNRCQGCYDAMQERVQAMFEQS